MQLFSSFLQGSIILATKYLWNLSWKKWYLWRVSWKTPIPSSRNSQLSPLVEPGNLGIAYYNASYCILTGLPITKKQPHKTPCSQIRMLSALHEVLKTHINRKFPFSFSIGISCEPLHLFLYCGYHESCMIIDQISFFCSLQVYRQWPDSSKYEAL